MELYLTRLADSIPENLARLAERICPQRKEEIRGYHYKEDGFRALLGSALVRYVLINRYGYKEKLIRFRYGRFGKPELETGKVFFNVSHSHSLVGAVFHHSPVGLDLEYIRKKPLYHAAARILDEEEYAVFERLPYERKADWFTERWVRKESYLKFAGCGITVPANEIQQTGQLMKGMGLPQGYVQEIGIIPQFKVAVCAGELCDFCVDFLNTQRIIDTFGQV